MQVHRGTGVTVEHLIIVAHTLRTLPLPMLVVAAPRLSSQSRLLLVVGACTEPTFSDHFLVAGLQETTASMHGPI